MLFVERARVESVWVVRVKATDRHGRSDEAIGAVAVTNAKGDAFTGEAMANALMKAETKAKRRATLSICGLGWSDDSEVETIPGMRVVEPLTIENPSDYDSKTGELLDEAAATPKVNP